MKMMQASINNVPDPFSASFDPVAPTDIANVENAVNRGNIFTDPKSLPPDQWPQSFFYLPVVTKVINGRTVKTSNVSIAYDWYQKPDIEFKNDPNFDVATGAIVNVNDISTWHNVIAGSYHIEQFDNTKPGFFNVNIFPTIKSVIESNIKWTL